MSRPGASERVRRLLSLVPWVAAHPDGVEVDEVCERFQIRRDVLLADLDALMMVGLPPYTPDTFVDAWVEDDRVVINPQWFDRPLRLTPEQALALVATGASLLQVPGADPDGPLARGLAKLAAAVDVDPAAIEVDLGRADPGRLELLLQARRERRAVEIDYYAYGRDQRSHRVGEPWQVYADQGQWYLQAHCRQAGGERLFRVDRIHGATLLDEVVEPPVEDATLGVFHPDAEDPTVTLDLGAGARWVVEQYPCEAVDELGDGRVRATLRVTAPAWLERLLVRLGPQARVVDGDPALAGAGRRAAERILARYRGG